MAEVRAPSMDWTRPDRSIAYKLFKQKTQMYFEYKEVPKAKQVSHILLMTGDEGLTLFNSWDLSEADGKNPDEVWKRFDAHIEPTSSFRVERLTFQRMRQLPDESADDFISRLTNQAKLCKFKDRNERIVEQITFGTKYADVQKSLLVQDEDYTLERAIEACRIHEASVGHQWAFKEIQEADIAVNAVGTSPIRCQGCGEYKHRSAKGCPAQDAICYNCGKKGHWAKACRQRKKSDNHGRWNQGGHNKAHKSASVSEVHEEPEEMVYHAIRIHVDELACEGSAYATVNIDLPHKQGKHALRLKIDTGAEGNILPVRTFRRIFPECLDAKGYPVPSSVTKKPNVSLSAYNGTPIMQHGYLTLQCRYKSESWTPLGFYIAESDGPAILGLEGCKQLNVVHLNCDEMEIKPSQAHRPSPRVSSIDDLKKSFPSNFDTLGNFAGEYHLHVDPQVPPVVHPARRFPIQRMDAIKEELSKMVEMGVITRELEPTEWVSSLTFTEKQDGSLRVCLDPKDLNKALKRPHHKTPTLDEVTHHFSGAKFFSKLDAKNGYWSIHLDEESSRLTTFNTPFGRYRFLRLPFGLVVSQDVFQQRMDAILEKCHGCHLGEVPWLCGHCR